QKPEGTRGVAADLLEIRLLEDAPHVGQPGQAEHRGERITRAAAWVRFVGAARRERERGKGRRPGAREIERLSRRVGLEDGSYGQALAALRDLAGPRKEPGLREYLESRYGQAAAGDDHAHAHDADGAGGEGVHPEDEHRLQAG